MENLSEIIKDIVLNYSLMTIEDIIQGFEKFDLNKFSSSKSNIISSIYDSELRNKVSILINKINDPIENISPNGIALAIKSAALIKQYEYSYERVETIWTGPDSEIIPLRRTDMALTQLINSAEKELLIVTYTVYKIDKLIEEIEKAIEKNIIVRFILEDQKRNNQNIEEIKNKFGELIKNKGKFYIWPKISRPFDNESKACLHVKCATADEKMLFLSSANLTKPAMNLNMELGVLITGGEQPRNIVKHFNALIENNVLVQV